MPQSSVLIYGINIAGLYLCDADSDVVTNARTWTRAAFESLSFSDLDHPALAKVSCKFRYPLTGCQKDSVMPGNSASFYKITGTAAPFTETLMFSGVVERVLFPDESAVVLDITSSEAIWTKSIPRQFSTMCGYTNTSQCPYALTCAKSFAACTSNAKTSIFGGFRFILPPGSKITFREYGDVAGGGGDGGGGGGPVIIPV